MSPLPHKSNSTNPCLPHHLLFYSTPQTLPVTAPNEYSLFFANCASETKVSMSVRTEVFNLDREGSRDFLSAGLTRLPSLYTLYSLAYIAFLAIWIYVCYHERNIVQRIHLVMGLLLLFKALNLICAAEDKHYIKIEISVEHRRFGAGDLDGDVVDRVLEIPPDFGYQITRDRHPIEDFGYEGGGAAEGLGLDGPVLDEDVVAVVANDQNAASGARLVSWLVGRHRGGYYSEGGGGGGGR
ncbi:hypothetical protein Tsubulata_034491 [Turnera subulata]|uniref:CAND6/7 N-terminal domain-containing protein n=1 Tax=Turnera subulata TaxID=218843 RepID=A0A9Q0FN94_9ROSI|nr:hypothetical protein Tsubulata_034491 [Turnera subulata]